MSLSVQKRFNMGEPSMDKSTLPLSFPTLNNFHQDRYGSFFQRSGGGSVGKPVVGNFRHSHYDDPSLYLNNMRGMDDRDKLSTMRSISQKLGNTTALAQRQFS